MWTMLAVCQLQIVIFNDTGLVEWDVGDIWPEKFRNICAQEYILMIAWQYKDDV